MHHMMNLKGDDENESSFHIEGKDDAYRVGRDGLSV